MIINPTSLSGCYWWLDASSITGIPNGSGVPTWTDLSGSGNTMTAGPVPPTFITPSINGRSSIRFPGMSTNCYFKKTGTNPAADITKGTWFVVYNSPGSGAANGLQCLMSNESLSNTSSQWNIGINTDNTFSVGLYPSGWLFQTAEGSLPQLTSAKGFTVIKPEFVNNWLIRSERTAGPWHSFFLNGSVAGSSNATNGSSSMQLVQGDGGTLGVGYSDEFSSYVSLWADVAEIIAYNRELSNNEMSDVHTYLKYKYFIGGVSNVNLYTVGGSPTPTPTPPSDFITTPLAVSGCYWWLNGDDLGGTDGHSITTLSDSSGSGNVLTAVDYPASTAIYNKSGPNGHAYVDLSGETFNRVATPSCNITEGSWFIVYDRNIQPSYNAEFFISNSNNSQSTILWQIGNDLDNTAMPSSGYLFQSGSGFNVNTSEVFTKPEYIYNGWNIRADRTKGATHDFFLNGNLLGNTSASGMTSGWGGTLNLNPGTAKTHIAEIVAYSRSLNDTEMGQVNNYLRWKYFINSYGCPLYVFSSATQPSGLSIYTAGAAYQFNTASLYVGSSLSVASGVNTFVQAVNQQGGVANLYVHNYTSISGGVTLYTQASLPPGSGNVSLYTDGIGIGVGARSLFTIGSLPPTSSNTASLFTFSAMPPVQSIFKTTPLFIGGTSIQSHMSMFVAGPSQMTSNFNIPMFLKTTELINPVGLSADLFVQNNTSSVNKGAKLYVQGQGSLDGGSIASNSMPLYINRFLSNACSMFISGTNTLASGTNLFINGAAIGSTSLYVSGGANEHSQTATLYVSGPMGINNSVSLFIGGYPQIHQSSKLYVRGF